MNTKDCEVKVGVKWIKITTDLFDDEKIKIIDTLPARDEILVIWFKLLALAGKSNQNGFLLMNGKVAYSPEMLSAVFNRELNSIKLALTTFENFGMIEIETNDVINIVNWEKHQNIDGLDKIRLQTNERVKRHREKKKQDLLQLQEPKKCNVTSNATVTDSNETEEELELELERESSSIINYKGDEIGDYQVEGNDTINKLIAKAQEGMDE